MKLKCENCRLPSSKHPRGNEYCPRYDIVVGSPCSIRATCDYPFKPKNKEKEKKR